ncbi:ABC transporter ATP-binding protein [Saccharopolyspora dendranthemae]|uniref:ABC-2 type transport system ATP-binding protein n=1 Tax=Saccharopolyspora dendranthemae TaxID=1181886 RepID=A0A561U054_9PSEU|nr:ABC transporter ATP-binding protein [Saccharopolyspora dendranthemae]TWF92738.1 ABC-2 type transport system ATP-binding protein [Saccharopolyspora dendranthemae]
MHDGSGRIHVQGLNKRFGPVHAVQDLSFTVQPGAVTGFLGPNGAGKTTALRMILGLVTPTSGTATINGLPFSRLPKPGGVVGAVLDAHGFHPSRTARHHLLCYSAAMDVPDGQVDRALELVGLAAAADRKAGGFSLGMRQRLALATALLGDPQILILDEPANGLDPEGIAWLRGFLHAFAAGGRTVLMSSHFLREIEHTADRLVIISQGRCVYEGHVDELRAAQQSRALVQADSPEALVNKAQEAGYGVEYLPDGRLAVLGADSRTVADLALQAGVALYAMQDERIDLEQLFFQLTHGQFAGLAQHAPPTPETWARPGDGGGV